MDAHALAVGSPRRTKVEALVPHDVHLVALAVEVGIRAEADPGVGSEVGVGVGGPAVDWFPGAGGGGAGGEEEDGGCGCYLHFHSFLWGGEGRGGCLGLSDK